MDLIGLAALPLKIPSRFTKGSSLGYELHNLNLTRHCSIKSGIKSGWSQKIFLVQFRNKGHQGLVVAIAVMDIALYWAIITALF